MSVILVVPFRTGLKLIGIAGQTTEKIPERFGIDDLDQVFPIVVDGTPDLFQGIVIGPVHAATQKRLAGRHVHVQSRSSFGRRTERKIILVHGPVGMKHTVVIDPHNALPGLDLGVPEVVFAESFQDMADLI